MANSLRYDPETGLFTTAVSVVGSLTNDVTLQSAVSATGNGASLDVTGQSTAVFTVLGTFVGTVNFEYSPNSGTSWFPLLATGVGLNTIASTATVPGSYRSTVTGLKLVRARVTWTSGTSITVTANTSVQDASPKVVNANILGSLTNPTVQETVIFNALAITSTSANTVTIDTSNLSKISFVGTNTLNQPVTIAVKTVGGGSVSYSTLVSKSASAGVAFNITGADSASLNGPLKKIQVTATCTVAPISGSLMMYMEAI